VGVVQIKIPRPRWEKVVGVWIKLHNEEFHDSYPSTSIGVVKARGMTWMSHVRGI
jgi:hypothetical protein